MPRSAIEPLTGRTATDIADGVRAGDLDPVAVVAAHLDRVEALQPRIGSYLAIRREQALAEATALADRDDLAELPLAGVPVAIKDVTDVAGLPTRHGTAATGETPATEDSPVVARLRAAGAIVVGTTLTPELSLWSSTDGAFGTARNPWNTDRVPGGSSGGSAAAVASGTVPIALGTDGLGSVRIPAACCGLFGLKPGRGGGVTESDMRGGGEHWFGMSEFGPLATTVQDAALMLSVFAERPDYRDPHPPAQPLRVAVSVERPSPITPLDDQYVRAVRQTAEHLEAAGHQVRTADVGYPLWLSMALLSRWTAAAAIDVAALDESKLQPRTRGHARLGRTMQRLGRVKPEHQQRWREHVATFFEQHDVLVVPALALPPIEAKAWSRASWPANVKAHMDYSPFCSPWNLAQVPAAAVPTGIGAAGVPTAVQLVGPTGSERRLLEVAAQLEAVASPRPVVLCPRLFSVLLNDSNTSLSVPSGRPGPSSSTTIHARPSSLPPRSTTVGARPSTWRYRKLLSRTRTRTSTRASESAATEGNSSETSTAARASAMRSWSCSTACLAAAAAATGSMVRARRLARPCSPMSSTRRPMRSVTSNARCSRWLLNSPRSGSSSRTRSRKPRSVARLLRRSWLATDAKRATSSSICSGVRPFGSLSVVPGPARLSCAR